MSAENAASPPFHTSTQYRPDVDGLRALAVIPVVLYHAGAPIFSGGFLGVDVFFVISGFLITTILHREIGEGRFSIVNFYERRARRILPAYTVVALFALAVGVLVLLPAELRPLGSSAVAASLFASNIYFYGQADYFGPDLETAPLLHTWSLSVEEQFYIVFPLLLLVLSRIGKTGLLAILGVISVATLWGTEWALDHHWNGRSYAFYGSHLRAWELLAGSLLAIGKPPALRSRGSRDALSVIALVMILVPMLFMTSATRFPGLSAVAPVLGTALLIYVGTDGKESIGGRLLQWRVFVWFGLISYSLYLWHWPFFVYTKIVFLHEPPAWAMAGVTVLSVVAAWLSLQFVERPFREKRFGTTQPRMFAVAAVALAAVVLTGGIYRVTKGLPGRIPEDVARVAAFSDDKSPMRERCHGMEKPVAEPCVLGAEGLAPSYAVWGDSHSVSVSDRLGVHFAERGRAGLHFSAAACAPAANFWNTMDVGCREQNTAALERLRGDPGIRDVVLVTRYHYYLEPHDAWLEGWDEAFEQGFAETIRALAEAGKNVVVMAPIPEPGFDAPSTMARAQLLALEAPTLAADDHYAANRRPLALIEALRDQFPQQVRVFDPAPALCPQGRCAFLQQGVVTHSDSDHLTLSGAETIVEGIAGLMQGARRSDG